MDVKTIEQGENMIATIMEARVRKWRETKNCKVKANDEESEEEEEEGRRSGSLRKRKEMEAQDDEEWKSAGLPNVHFLTLLTKHKGVLRLPLTAGAGFGNLLDWLCVRYKSACSSTYRHDLDIQRKKIAHYSIVKCYQCTKNLSWESNAFAFRI